MAVIPSACTTLTYGAVYNINAAAHCSDDESGGAYLTVKCIEFVLGGCASGSGTYKCAFVVAFHSQGLLKTADLDYVVCTMPVWLSGN